jgi:hypothetical protein
MFNNEKAITCLKGLVGFEQPYVTEIPDLDADLTTSASGIIVGSAYMPLLSYENITACAHNFAQALVKPWVSTVAYRKNAVVKVGSDIYYALQTGTNQNPTASGSEYWAKTTLLSAYLRRMYESSSVKLVTALGNHKKLKEAGKQLLGTVMMYEGQGNIYKRLQRSSRFVGLRLTLREPDTVAQLTKLGLQLHAPQADFKVYLFHSSSTDPIRVWTLNHTKTFTFQWHVITQETLSFLGTETAPGGHYYIGYDEDEATVDAVDKDIFWDGRGCGSCTEAVVNRQWYGKWGKFMTVQPFYVTGFTGQLWDEESEVYVEGRTWGLNFQMSVQCDLTTLMCSNTVAFADALSKQITVDLLNDMAFSMRDNQLKNRAAQMAAVALDNQENGQSGWMRMLNKSIESLDFDFSNLSGMCNPCAQGRNQARKVSVWGR